MTETTALVLTEVRGRIGCITLNRARALNALSLEYAVEFIEDDELVEITPKSVRVRKRFLKESDRKRAGR